MRPSDIKEWLHTATQQPVPFIVGFAAGALLTSFIATKIVLPYELTSVKLSYDECNRNKGDITNRLMSIEDETRRKDEQLQHACKQDDFNKLKDDAEHFKALLGKCENDIIDRENRLAQAQTGHNTLRTRNEDLRAQLSKLNSLEVQYDRLKKELSRCQREVVRAIHAMRHSRRANTA